MDDIKLLFVFSGLFLLLLVIAEILFRVFKIKTEYTRKFAHFSTGIATLSIPYYFNNHYVVLALTLLFLSLLLLSKKINLFRSIDSIQRKTIGSYLFPVSIYICFLISDFYNDKALFVIPVLVLAISDTLAAVFGTFLSSKQLIHPLIKDKKTIAGSSAFFISTFLIIIFTAPIFQVTNSISVFVYAITISCFSTFVEMVSRKGFDNLTVPLSVSFL